MNFFQEIPIYTRTTFQLCFNDKDNSVDTLAVVMCRTVLPGNRTVVLSEVYEMDSKGHGTHRQNIYNFES